jgi:hypothetical protein
VVDLHHTVVHHAFGVLDELRHRGRELAGVAPQGFDEGANGFRGGLAALPTELVHDEVGLVAVGLDRGALDDPGLHLDEGVDRPFAALGAGVRDDEGDVVRGHPQVVGQVVDELVGRFVEALHDDCLVTAEERRAGMRRELARLVRRGGEPDHVEVGAGLAQVPERGDHGPLGEELFRSANEDRGRWCAHASTLSRLEDIAHRGSGARVGAARRPS